VIRREFITLLGGAAAAWPVAARAQQPERVRRIGVLMFTTSDEPESQARITALGQGLQEAGWSVGRNVRIDVRWSGGDFERVRRDAQELVSLGPDVLVAGIGPTTQAFQQISRTLPIVFAQSVDPVGLGIIKSMARPGRNATGFTLMEYSTSGKWLELLKEIAPGVTRVAVIRDSAITGGIGQWASIQSMAPSVGVEIIPVNMPDAAEIERSVMAFARGANGGLILTASGSAFVHHGLIIALAARYKLPAVYFERFFAAKGGLISYGAELLDQYRRAANYVDRILRGENPADLPVQAPTKYELVINLKTAKALGLEVPPTLLARADEVIE
jgi:putative ABC transport system substrate-binding protein